MSTKQTLSIVLLISLVVTAGISARMISTARANPIEQGSGDLTIPYPGQLSDGTGQPVVDGKYAFSFTLYDAQNGGTSLWSEVQEEVSVNQATFLAILGSHNPIPASITDNESWLEVAVRGPGETVFSTLTPRQQMSNSTSFETASTDQGMTCEHDHFGETWSGNSGYGLGLDNDGLIGLYAKGLTWSIWGEAGGTLVNSAGVYGNGTSATSFGGHFINNFGGTGLKVEGVGVTNDSAALLVKNTLVERGGGVAAYFENTSLLPTVSFRNRGLAGSVLYLQNNGDNAGTSGGDFIRAISRNNEAQFVVGSDGTVYNDTGLYTSPADFAEMLPAVDGLEPGDVLAIGSKGELVLSSSAYQTSVAGVYSTEPGFVGGHPIDGKTEGTIPLAIVGIVPVKVIDENGAIQPGDLLVTSSTPGYAMKAGSNPLLGSVIGKAMEALDEGSGLIKMLATLQ